MSFPWRVLIVEDRQDDFEGVQYSLAPRDVKRLPAGVRFEVEWVRTVNEARQRLRQALQACSPYDVLLLDMQLPYDSVDPRVESPVDDAGLDVLREVDPSNCASVVAASAVFSFSEALQKLTGKVAAFVPKESDHKPLIWALINAAVSGRKSQEAAWLLAAESRASRWLYTEAQGHLIERFSDAAAFQAAQMLDLIEAISDQLDHRFRLNRQQDAEDPICQLLGKIERTAREYSSHQTFPTSTTPEGYGVLQDGVDLGDLLQYAIAKYWAGFAFHRIRLAGIDLQLGPVRVFIHEVRDILIEMVFVALKSSGESDGMRELWAWTRASADGNTLLVGLRAPARQGGWEPQILDAINQCNQMNTEDNLARGLVLAHRLAGSVGGQLKVTSGAESDLYELLLPRMPHG